MRQQELPRWRTDNIISMIASAFMIIATLGAVFYRQGITQEKLDNLIQLTQEIRQTQQSNLQAMNRLESHVCALDTKSGIVCIANQ